MSGQKRAFGMKHHRLLGKARRHRSLSLQWSASDYERSKRQEAGYGDLPASVGNGPGLLLSPDRASYLGGYRATNGNFVLVG